MLQSIHLLAVYTLYSRRVAEWSIVGVIKLQMRVAAEIHPGRLTEGLFGPWVVESLPQT